MARVMKDFTVLQKKTFSTDVFVSLCPTMDICAVLSNSTRASSTSHVLDAFRTFSWEKNFSKSDIVGSSVSVFDFSPSGKVLAIGSEDGSVAIIDLESTNSVTAMTEEQLPSDVSTIADTVKTPVTAISWVQLDSTLPAYMDKCRTHIWLQGGPNLAARAGMCELYEADDADSDGQLDTIPLSALLSSVAHTLLLTLNTASQRLNIYACGVYLIHSMDLSAPEYSISFLLGDVGESDSGRLNSLYSGRPTVVTSSSGPASCITLCRRFYSSRDRQMNSDESTPPSEEESEKRKEEGLLGTVAVHSGLHITLIRHLPFLTTYCWHQHKTRLLLQMQKDLARINTLLLECGKKWRDAAKVIPMKLSLLASTLKGYEMNYTPVQFFYTIALFGQWHPAAQSSFGSHWNAQGIQRLRSSISSAAKDIEKRLEMYVIPVLTNFLLGCRELVGIEEAEEQLVGHDVMKSRKEQLKKLIDNAEWLMYKVDEALHESRYAGRNLLLFLQFLKENMLAAASADESHDDQDTPAPMQHASPADFLPLFDPRIPRAAEGVFGPKAHAECVTGTHLYAYFLESPLPEDVVEYRKPFNGFYSNIRADKLPGFKNVETLKGIMEIAEANSSFDAESFAKLSLLSQFKTTSVIFQNVLQHGQHMPNVHFNADDSENYPNNPMRQGFDENLVFNFQGTGHGALLADDVSYVYNVAIPTDDENGVDLVNSDESSGDGSDDDHSIAIGKVQIGSGHLVVFAFSSREFLIIWRITVSSEVESSRVEWYARLISLDLPDHASSFSQLTAIKLYSCSAAESYPSRVALVGCLSPAPAFSHGSNEDAPNSSSDSLPAHVLFKLDLVGAEFNYMNVTHLIEEKSDPIAAAGGVVHIGNNILSVFNSPEKTNPKLRHVNFSGVLMEIKACATRGLLSLMLAEDGGKEGAARQMIILDMEEDEEDDSESEEEEESEGEMEQ